MVAPIARASATARRAGRRSAQGSISNQRWYVGCYVAAMGSARRGVIALSAAYLALGASAFACGGALPPSRVSQVAPNRPDVIETDPAPLAPLVRPDPAGEELRMARSPELGAVVLSGGGQGAGGSSGSAGSPSLPACQGGGSH